MYSFDEMILSSGGFKMLSGGYLNIEIRANDGHFVDLLGSAAKKSE